MIDVRVLVGSSIRQDKEVLREFITSLGELNKSGCMLDYFFIDDGEENENSNLLLSLGSETSKVYIEKSSAVIDSKSDYDGGSHNWSYATIERVAKLKNRIIDFALSEQYNYLLLIDSDIVLHKETLHRLLSLGKDIVSNIFWTKTSRWGYYEPQVWLMDQRHFFDPSDPLTKKKIYRTEKHMEFIEMLKEKGTYKVGGLGACTLISRRVLLAGVNFTRLYNISFWGEDRAFCIRAVSAGFDLYVDTYYPAYHIYRKIYLKGVHDFKENGFNFSVDVEHLSLYDKIKRGVECLKIFVRHRLYKIFYEK